MPAPLVLRRFLVALVAVVMVALPVGQAAASVPTGKPTTILVDDTFVAPNLTANCGFEVIAHFHGTIRVTEDPETGAFFVRYAIKRDFIGPGASLSSPDVGLDRLVSQTIDGDILVLVIASSGNLPYQVAIPGYGIVASNTGLQVVEITIDMSTGEELDFVFLTDVGLNIEITPEGFAILCDYLEG
jgi:hypothetical protein